MKKDKKQSIWLKAEPTVSLSKATKSSMLMARSAVLALILLCVISTLRSTIFLQSAADAMLFNFVTLVFVLILSTGFTYLYSLKRFKTLIFGGISLLLVLAGAWLRTDIYYGAILAHMNFLEIYNLQFNTNFISYFTFDTQGVPAAPYIGLPTLMIVIVCILLSLLFGYLINKQKASIPFLILSLPLIWASINFAYKPIVLPLTIIFFTILSLLAIESTARAKRKINSDFTNKLRHGKVIQTYNGGFVTSRAVSKNMISALALVLTLIIMVVTIFPSSGYIRPKAVQEISYDPVAFFQKLGDKLKIDQLLSGDFGFIFTPSSGMSGGNISQIDRNGFRGETHLMVTPSQKVSMLLKGYVGSAYDDINVSWGDLPDSVYEENSEVFDKLNAVDLPPQALTNRFLRTIDEANERYKKQVKEKTGEDYEFDVVKLSATGIKNVKADTRYLYLPYTTSEVTGYSDSTLYYRDTIAEGKKIGREPYEVTSELLLYFSNSKERYQAIQDYDSYRSMYGDGTHGYTHLNGEPFEDAEAKRAAVEAYDKFVYENYLQIPKGKYQRLIDDMSFERSLESKTDSEIKFKIERVKNYLNSNAEYDLSPGKLPEGKDYIEYFLYENHRGYCTNFATAGVMLFRAVGIPARYVEGYTVTQYDYEKRTNQDGSVRIEDSNAHAWVEIYMKGNGWVAVDVTPGFSGEAIADYTVEPTVSKDEPSQQSSSEPSSQPSSEPSSEASSSELTSSTPQSDDSNAVTSGGESGMSLVILTTAGMILLLITIIFLKWWLVSKIRGRHFNQKDKNKAVIKAYRYAEDILSFVGISKKQEETELQFADRAKSECPYVKDDSFAELTETALKAGFSNHSINGDEHEERLKYVKALSDEIYKGLKPIEKLRYWLIDNLK